MRTFASATTRGTSGVALGASGLQLLAYQRQRSVFVEIAAPADASDQRAQVVGADRTIYDLALADVCLGDVGAQDRRYVRVEIDADC